MSRPKEKKEKNLVLSHPRMSVAAKMFLKIILKALREKITLENNFQWMRVTNFLAIRKEIQN